MATIGLPKSVSVMPVARQSARAPAALRPMVVVRERSGGISMVLGSRGLTCDGAELARRRLYVTPAAGCAGMSVMAGARPSLGVSPCVSVSALFGSSPPVVWSTLTVLPEVPDRRE
ncbi:hypothetical protein IU459_34315 [Nocardia amamiensis]|uniref:Uncharacterized protein n=1 Tax=Nocardia amamiensis TaxID=404578 RepID=A0ABS0D1R7_9NOCA|nr:hypothetical protein [Nocardia amamiensis]MBF6302576.1 hypothetical protein [Nocardia amamiensis]